MRVTLSESDLPNPRHYCGGFSYGRLSVAPAARLAVSADTELCPTDESLMHTVRSVSIMQPPESTGNTPAMHLGTWV